MYKIVYFNQIFSEIYHRLFLLVFEGVSPNRSEAER